MEEKARPLSRGRGRGRRLVSASDTPGSTSSLNSAGTTASGPAGLAGMGGSGEVFQPPRPAQSTGWQGAGTTAAAASPSPPLPPTTKKPVVAELSTFTASPETIKALQQMAPKAPSRLPQPTMEPKVQPKPEPLTKTAFQPKAEPPKPHPPAHSFKAQSFQPPPAKPAPLAQANSPGLLAQGFGTAAAPQAKPGTAAKDLWGTAAEPAPPIGKAAVKTMGAMGRGFGKPPSPPVIAKVMGPSKPTPVMVKPAPPVAKEEEPSPFVAVESTVCLDGGPAMEGGSGAGQMRTFADLVATTTGRADLTNIKPRVTPPAPLASRSPTSPVGGVSRTGGPSPVTGPSPVPSSASSTGAVGFGALVSAASLRFQETGERPSSSKIPNMFPEPEPPKARTRGAAGPAGPSIFDAPDEQPKMKGVWPVKEPPRGKEWHLGADELFQSFPNLPPEKRLPRFRPG